MTTRWNKRLIQQYAGFADLTDAQLKYLAQQISSDGVLTKMAVYKLLLALKSDSNEDIANAIYSIAPDAGLTTGDIVEMIMDARQR
jgi:hypothetical protein